MAKSDNKPSETETILMALDQISQTIDVMTSVVGRLRHYLEQEAAATGQQQDAPVASRRDRILH